MSLYRPENAPEGFTEKMMGRIRSKPSSVYKPVFGKWFLREILRYAHDINVKLFDTVPLEGQIILVIHRFRRNITR
jgi:hypothetical protein